MHFALMIACKLLHAHECMQRFALNNFHYCTSSFIVLS